MSIVAEAPDFLQVFSDGSVKRFYPKIAPVSFGSSGGYMSKDVTIDPVKPITGRMFLPGALATMDFERQNKVPVVVYFHGGGFCIGSTTWLGYHVFLGELALKAGVIILSIDYRLAPENRLPVAYKYCYFSLEWLMMNHKSDPWLELADLSRIFLSGDSAGGNIVHNVAIEIIKSNDDFTKEMEIKGLLLIHPYFGSEMRTPKEMINEDAIEVRMNDMFWKLSIPKGSNRDYYGCNFEVFELSEDEWGQFPGVVVFVAELDFLNERGENYVEYMKKRKVSHVRLIETKEENHIFHVYHPHSEATYLLQRQMIEFINLSN